MESVLLEMARELVLKETDILGEGTFLSTWGTVHEKEQLQDCFCLVCLSVLSKWQQTLSRGAGKLDQGVVMSKCMLLFSGEALGLSPVGAEDRCRAQWDLYM